MKRSEINNEIRQAEEFFASFQFKLPKFACWTPAEMRARRNDPKYREIFECNLGWDLTDFGKGKFREEGLFLFTIRNGITGSTRYPKPYAEKIMISRSNQLTLTHCHEFKREDIINRGGGRLVFELFNRKGNTGAELNNSALFSGSTTLAFGKEKILAIYEKEHDVEQTIGIPILCRIPVIKYLFSTTTTIKERTYIVVSVEAVPVDIQSGKEAFNTDSVATKIDRRIENPFRSEKKSDK